MFIIYSAIRMCEVKYNEIFHGIVYIVDEGRTRDILIW